VIVPVHVKTAPGQIFLTSFSGGVMLFVLIDQFEELFHFSMDQKGRRKE
jgi:hypothetical protein